MTARISRGGAARSGGGRPRAKAGGRSVNTRKRKNPGMLESVGLSPEFGQRITGWSFAALAVIAIVAATLVFRVPQMVGVAIGEGVGEAGFAMSRVEIKGANRVSRLAIYNAAFDQPSMAMPLVDLDATRERLLQFGWVKDARVSRRLPDTLVVDIVERQPAAIWQNEGRLSLVDAEGVVLEPVRIEAMPELPLVIGGNANRHVAELAGLLGAAEHLRPQVTGATWVGGRRWDLRFQTGEVLSLPEGDEPARRAIGRFALMDQQDPLLGRGFARIDMRDPRRTYVRVSREPGTRVPDLLAPRPTPSPGAQPPQDLRETI